MRRILVAVTALAATLALSGSAAAAPDLYHHRASTQMHHQSPEMLHHGIQTMFHNTASARWAGYTAWPSTNWSAAITQCSIYPNRMRVRFTNDSSQTVTVRIVGGFYLAGGLVDRTLYEQSPRLSPHEVWYVTLTSLSDVSFFRQSCRLITVHRKV